MPPKKRKVGLRRIDAAFDAMRPMGFPISIVRKCLKSLLETYGDEGWTFIEEGAYNVLIETILEELASSQLRPDSAPQPLSSEAAENSASCSLQFLEASSHNSPQHPLLFQEAGDKASMLKEGGDKLVEVDAQASSLIQDVIVKNAPTPNGGIGRKRKPCYGWISDDNTDVFVRLTPYDSQGFCFINSTGRFS